MEVNLRKPESRDYEEFKNLVLKNIDFMNSFLGWDPTPWKEDDLYHFLSYLEIVKMGSKGLNYFVCLGNELVGFVYLQISADGKSCQISGWGSRDYANKGIGNQVLKILVYRIFRDFEVDFIELHFDKENVSSRILAIKNGFQDTKYRYQSTFQSQSGSGEMEVWILYRPNLRILQSLDKGPITRIFSGYITGRSY